MNPTPSPTTTAGITSGLNQITSTINSFTITIIVVAIVVIVASVVISFARARSMQSRGHMPEDELRWRREDLIEKVGEASQTEGMAISLRGYWRHSEVTKPQRYVILKDLLKRQVLYPAYSQNAMWSFFQALRWNTLHMPVTVVRLSNLNWQRLASGAAAGIIANGDVIIVRDSPGAGVVSRSPNATQTLTQEITPELVQAVVQALKRDAQELIPGNPLREQAESFADTLQHDATMNRWESVKNTLSDVLAFAANGASLWASTLTILDPR